MDTDWTLARLVVDRCQRVLLIGPPGIGKSRLALANRPNNWAQITLNDDLSVQELMGFYRPLGGHFEWRHGPIVEQMAIGGLLVVNEVDRASNSVKDFLLGILDDPDVAAITLPSGERVTPNQDFRVIATSNAEASVLDSALRSRFEAEVVLRTPHPELIKHLDAQVHGLGRAVSDSFKDDTVRALDPRRAISFAKLLKSGLPARQAALAAFGDRGADVFAVLASTGVV